jgi:hypothetical protein
MIAELCGGVGPASQHVTIESLPDNVLLDIFEFYLNIDRFTQEWELLVQVCRRWRYVIFASPIRLELHILCTLEKPMRKLSDVWPELPLALLFYPDSKLHNLEESVDAVVAALEHPDRIRHIEFTIPEGSDILWRTIVTEMEKPFPALISLCLDRSTGEEVHLPDTFMDGSAPSLIYLTLVSISFPSLPRLLLSTRDLTYLDLFDIPNCGYITPETMATSLSALPKLRSLIIKFKYWTPQSERSDRPLPPQTRSVLPALIRLIFKGVSEYLEVLAAQIDAPLLNDFEIHFFYQRVFDIPQIIRFLGHVKSFNSSSLALDYNSLVASIFFSSSTRCGSPSWNVHCYRGEKKITSLAQLCRQILRSRPNVNSLIIDIVSDLHPDHVQVDPTLWLQLFRIFPSVQSFETHVLLEPSIAAALEELTEESAAEVFPSLHSLSIVGKTSDEAIEQGIQSFIAARQHSSHPVALSRLEENYRIRPRWRVSQ